VPLFLSECAPASRRGQVVSTSYLFQVAGVLTSYFVNFTVVQLSSEDWRLMLGLILIPATTMLLVTLAVPESPRWLASRLRLAEAAAVLRRLRSDPDIRPELRVIVNSLFTSADGHTEPARVLLSPDAVNADAERHDDDKDTAPLLGDHGPSGSLHVTALPAGIVPTPTGPSVRTVLTRPDARRAFLLCAGLEFFQQFSGIQAVVLYTPVILKASGVAYLFVDLGLSESASVLLMTALIYSCKIPFLFLGMYNVDNLGRRTVLLITLPIMAIALAGVAVSFALPDTTNAGAILAVVATTVFGCSYSPGLGSVLSVVESEIFASDVRSTGLVMTGTVGAVFNILIVQLYPLLSASLGEIAVFSAFAVSSALGFLFVYAFLPETKRQPLELSFRTVLKQPGVVAPAAAAS
jgi:MFS family permease